MQKKIFKNIIILNIFCGMLLVAGCSKSSSAVATKTKADFLVASTWKYSSAGIDNDGNGTIDVSLPAGTIETCVTDNLITFKSDKTGIIDEGATKCDASTAQTSPFTWTLSATDTLTLSTPILTGFGNDAKVLECSATRFVLSKTVSVSVLLPPLPVVVILVH